MIVVDLKYSGLRLDACLKDFFPHIGLRGLRRMIITSQVLVNGLKVKPAFKLKVGDKIDFKSIKDANQLKESPRFLEEKDHYYFFFKPSRLHTVKLFGSPSAALEDYLPTFFPNLEAPNYPILLQRLDWGTSGLICAAKSLNQVQIFRNLENSGRVVKKYLALLQGELPGIKIAQNNLATSGKLVRVSKDIAPSLYHTTFEPLVIFKKGEKIPNWLNLEQKFNNWPFSVTLVGCTLHKGMRHQIRVHAQSLGYPLLFDRQYGQIITDDSAVFYLHQVGLFFAKG